MLKCIFKLIIILIVLCCSFKESFSSITQVDSISGIGLVPDKEADLGFNPAYIKNINELTFFGGLIFSYNQNTDTTVQISDYTTSPSTTISKHTRKDYSFNPYMEYIHMFSNEKKISIKYNPNYSMDSNNYEYDNISTPEADKHTRDSIDKRYDFGSSRIIYGFPFSQEIYIGIGFSLNTYKRSWTTDEKDENPVIEDTFRLKDEYIKYTGNLACLINYYEGRSVGLSFKYSNNTTERTNTPYIFRQQDHMEEKETIHTIGLQISPEFIISDRSLIRCYIAFGFEHSRPTREYDNSYYTTPRHRYDAENNISDYILGAGYNYKNDSDTLWFFSLYFRSDLYYSKRYKEDLDTNTPDTYTKYHYTRKNKFLILQIGIEKELIKDILVLRGKISPFTIDYYNESEVGTGQDGIVQENDTYDSITYRSYPRSYSFGIGYKPLENLLVDILFYYFDSSYSASEESQYSLIENEDYNRTDNGKSIEFGFALTYTFPSPTTTTNRTLIPTAKPESPVDPLPLPEE